MDPKYARKLDDLRLRVLARPTETVDPALRRAAAEGGEVPPELAGYIDKVRRHAYRVTDDEVRDLVAAGYSEDQIFELTVAAAFGAAFDRLQAGLNAMAGAQSAGSPGNAALEGLAGGGAR
jgi:alkylhydroperoxidase family enzyme